MKKIIALILVFLLSACCCAAAEESSAISDAVKELAWPYYEAAIEVAQSSPDYGRDFTDHKTAHVTMTAVKSLEAAEAISSAVRLGTLGAQEPADGRVVLSGDIDLIALEGAALFHDSGMCGSGYALTDTTDENGNTVLMKDVEGHYVMHAEDNLNFAEVRTNHSLNSSLYVLVNRSGLRTAGYTDAQIDLMAAACMAHGT